VSGLGGDGEDNYGDGLTMAAKMVMERWTNYGGEDGDGAKLQVSRRWSTVVEPGDAVVVMNGRRRCWSTLAMRLAGCDDVRLKVGASSLPTLLQFNICATREVRKRLVNRC
jgi:phage gp37-like protein